MALPKIGKIILRKGGWSTQSIHLSRVNPSVLVYGKGNCPSAGINRGYVKIRNPAGEVVDRALTVRTAIHRISLLQKGTTQ